MIRRVASPIAVLALAACTRSSATQRPGLAEDCPEDHIRVMTCGPARAPGNTCPQSSRDAWPDDRFAAVDLWLPLDGLPHDATLTDAYRETTASDACCFSACTALEAKARPHSEHDYRHTVCIPAAHTSRRAASQPGCPTAIDFPSDVSGHVAALDPVASDRSTRAFAAGRGPDLQWCCYGTAPAGAIMPE